MQLQGADVVVTDPQAIANARRKWPDLKFADTAEEAVEGADAGAAAHRVAGVRRPRPGRTLDAGHRRRMLDGRNALDPAAWRAAGWTYRALGRP